MNLPRFLKHQHANKPAAKGASAWRMWFIYPLFGWIMLTLGLSSFLLAYGSDTRSFLFLYFHGSVGLAVWIVLYLVIFGRDAVSWMLLNAALGIVGIYAQIGWILERFGKRISDFPWQAHLVPFLYYVLYTFLLRQFLIDITRSRDNPRRRSMVDAVYVVGSVVIYGVLLWRGRTGD